MTKRRCTKKGYATRDEAEAEISAMVEKYGNVLFKKVYWCGKCKAWHITGTPPAGGRRIKH